MKPLQMLSDTIRDFDFCKISHAESDWLTFAAVAFVQLILSTLSLSGVWADGVYQTKHSKRENYVWKYTLQLYFFISAGTMLFAISTIFVISGLSVFCGSLAILSATFGTLIVCYHPHASKLKGI